MDAFIAFILIGADDWAYSLQQTVQIDKNRLNNYSPPDPRRAVREYT